MNPVNWQQIVDYGMAVGSFVLPAAAVVLATRKVRRTGSAESQSQLKTPEGNVGNPQTRK